MFEYFFFTLYIRFLFQWER